MFSVLGIDPNTWKTGLGLVTWPDTGSPIVHVATEFIAKDNGGVGSALWARASRMTAICESMEDYLGELKIADCVASPLVVAYEQHTWRGEDASEAISMITGALLAILFQSGCQIADVIAIDPKAAKAAWNGNRLEREDAKAAVVPWARREFRIALQEDQHDAADALAVCVAARGIWLQAERERLAEARRQQQQAAQRPLFGPGSRGGKRR